MPSLLTLSGDLARNRSQQSAQRQAVDARARLEATPVREVDGGSTMGGLVGGIVTRAGPLRETLPEAADQNVLARLDLRPVLVGVERDIIAAAIEGEAGAVRNRLADIKSDEIGRPDRASGWVIPLGNTGRIVRDVCPPRKRPLTSCGYTLDSISGS